VVGDVGYLSRGISHDEVYKWESYGDNINVVDLPGLGLVPTSAPCPKRRLVPSDTGGVLSVDLSMTEQYKNGICPASLYDFRRMCLLEGDP
jgi:hypothetical protein